ncbi:DUF3304 domain-containing protein [Litchfieldella rifensis]|uniref:DUF3304 domain-containing protein n=1 Tax=Litchfieldella rifensis TaxID=762643 RepID=A0ABV7LPW1_9GAMM
MLFRWAFDRFVPVWLQVVFVAGLIAAVAWQDYSRRDTGRLKSHNHTGRPIFSYWVNDNWGGNGGTTCCWSFRGDTAEVVWILDVTPKDIEAGLKEERHSVTLPMPVRSREDQYLHVHFLPGNRVEMAWSPTLQSPLSERLREEYHNDD